MAEKNQNLVLQWVTLTVACLLLIGSFTWMGAIVTIDEDAIADKVATQIDIPTPEITIPPVVANLSDVENRLDNIETILNEEDDWEDEAIALATAEWKDRDYREIYKAIEDIYNDIDDRDDIEYVRIKDEEVTSSDVDDKDATIVQKLRVKYEDKYGDDRKVYLTITTEIEDSEIEDQEIEETL